MSGAGRERLDRLYRLRRLEEESRGREFAGRLREEDEARLAAERARDDFEDRARTLFELLAEGAVDPLGLRRRAREIEDSERRIQGCGERLREAGLDRRRAEQEYRDARSRAESLDRLRERQEAADATDRRRAERKAEDEEALRRFRQGRPAEEPRPGED